MISFVFFSKFSLTKEKEKEKKIKRKKIDQNSLFLFISFTLVFINKFKRIIFKSHYISSFLFQIVVVEIIMIEITIKTAVMIEHRLTGK